jgi:hypothetical protein
LALNNDVSPDLVKSSVNCVNAVSGDCCTFAAENLKIEDYGKESIDCVLLSSRRELCERKYREPETGKYGGSCPED